MCILKHQVRVNLKISGKMFSSLWEAAITSGITEQSSSNWVNSVVDFWENIVMSSFDVSLMSFLAVREQIWRWRHSERAEHSTSKCSVVPSQFSSQILHDPSWSLVEKCLRSLSVLYLPEKSLAWTTALDTSKELLEHAFHSFKGHVVGIEVSNQRIAEVSSPRSRRHWL